MYIAHMCGLAVTGGGGSKCDTCHGGQVYFFRGSCHTYKRGQDYYYKRVMSLC